MGEMRAVVLVCLMACGGDGGGTAQATAKMLNGPSPGTVQMFAPRVAPASEGSWAVTPTRVVAPIKQFHFRDKSSGDTHDIDLTDCKVTFDLKQPALAQTLDCPFIVPAGTYEDLGITFGPDYELTVDDAVNGMYTDPSNPAKVTTTAPAGGGQPITVPNPFASLGMQVSHFGSKLTVNDGDTVTVSVLLQGLQSIQITITGGVAQLGIDGNNMPKFPDSVTSVGTPARIAFYANAALGTPYSVNASALMEKDMAVYVLYSGTSPAFLGYSSNHLKPCFSQTAFVYPAKNNGYLGLDSTGMLGWSGFSDMTGQMPSSLWRMHQVDTKGGTTTLECLSTTTDPMPPGDSFSSGAPNFSTPTASMPMTLLVN